MDDTKTFTLDKTRKLPNYTKGEELFNMITHITGGAFGLLILILCLTVSVRNDTPNGVAGSLVFGISAMLLYTVSSIYHGLRAQKAKKVFQVLDHCTIYCLIAGTYTPLLITGLVSVNPVAGYIYFGVEWLLAAIAITFTAIDMKKFSIFSMFCYIALGWGAILFAPLFIEALTLSGMMLVIAGGIAYTVGAVMYGVGKKKKYFHSIFHLFCLLGTLFHFLAVGLYCL